MFLGEIWQECPNSGSMGRDKLAHEYFGIMPEIVWKTIKKRLPELKPLIKELLKKMSEEAGD